MSRNSQPIASLNYLIALVTFFGLASPSIVCSQVYQLSGKVTDKSNGEAVPYASVGLEGMPVGTSTNLNGEFSLKMPGALKNQARVRISCVGFESYTIEAAEDWVEVALTPSKIQLKEVLVVGKDLRADKIVKRAFQRIRKNYYSKPFVYKTFYRHYCKDDSVYGRLIEAAVEIYKRKGHKTSLPSPGVNEEVRVVQIRRSLDSTKISEFHAPIALYSVMGSDPVSYQGQGTTFDLAGIFLHNVSTLKRRSKSFDFELAGITEYDGSEVFKIKYESKGEGVMLTTGILLQEKQQGTLYIHTKDYAIVRSEWERFAFDTIRTVTTYKKFKDKYFWQQTSKEGHTFNRQSGFRHTYHLDLMANEVVTENFEKFRGKEPDREQLLKIRYDSSFWSGYNLLKSTPLEDKIVADLGGGRSLSNQFAIHDSLASTYSVGARNGENDLNKFRESGKGTRIFYIDFWASWCGPCIQEMVFEKRLLEKHKDKITFVLVSIDSNEEAWKKGIAKYKLALPGFHHFWIGPNSDASRFYEITSIPRYLLIRKNGEFYDLQAKRPSDPELEKDFELLIKEGDQ